MQLSRPYFLFKQSALLKVDYQMEGIADMRTRKRSTAPRALDGDLSSGPVPHPRGRGKLAAPIRLPGPL